MAIEEKYVGSLGAGPPQGQTFAQLKTWDDLNAFVKELVGENSAILHAWWDLATAIKKQVEVLDTVRGNFSRWLADLEDEFRGAAATAVQDRGAEIVTHMKTIADAVRDTPPSIGDTAHDIIVYKRAFWDAKEVFDKLADAEADAFVDWLEREYKLVRKVLSTDIIQRAREAAKQLVERELHIPHQRKLLMILAAKYAGKHGKLDPFAIEIEGTAYSTSSGSGSGSGSGSDSSSDRDDDTSSDLEFDSGSTDDSDTDDESESSDDESESSGDDDSESTSGNDSGGDSKSESSGSGSSSDRDQRARQEAADTANDAINDLQANAPGPSVGSGGPGAGANDLGAGVGAPDMGATDGGTGADVPGAGAMDLAATSGPGAGSAGGRGGGGSYSPPGSAGAPGSGFSVPSVTTPDPGGSAGSGSGGSFSPLTPASFPSPGAGGGARGPSLPTSVATPTRFDGPSPALSNPALTEARRAVGDAIDALRDPNDSPARTRALNDAAQAADDAISDLAHSGGLGSADRSGSLQAARDAVNQAIDDLLNRGPDPGGPGGTPSDPAAQDRARALQQARDATDRAIDDMLDRTLRTVADPTAAVRSAALETARDAVDDALDGLAESWRDLDGHERELRADALADARRAADDVIDDLLEQTPGTTSSAEARDDALADAQRELARAFDDLIDDTARERTLADADKAVRVDALGDAKDAAVRAIDELGARLRGQSELSRFLTGGTTTDGGGSTGGGSTGGGGGSWTPLGVSSIAPGGSLGPPATNVPFPSPVVDSAALAENQGMPMAPPMGGMGGMGANARERERSTWLDGDPEIWQDDEDDAVSAQAIGRGEA